MSDFGLGYDFTVHKFEPTSGSVLTAQSLEPASDSLSPSLSALPLLVLSLSLSLSKIKKNIKKIFKKTRF